MHTKDDLLTSRVSKRALDRNSSHVARTSHDGVTAAPTAASAAELGAVVHNNNDREHIGEHEHVNGYTGGKPPKPKNHGATPVHGGMYQRGRDGTHFQSVTHQQVVNAPDASGRAPLDPTIPGKRLTPPKVTPGMRSRTTPGFGEAHFELGAAILAQATRNN